MKWVAGFSLEWKDANSGYCYFVAIFGQIVAMGSMGYTFVVMLDLLFIVCMLFCIEGLLAPTCWLWRFLAFCEF